MTARGREDETKVGKLQVTEHLKNKLSVCEGAHLGVLVGDVVTVDSLGTPSVATSGDRSL